jgi:hypothetical protein
MRIIDRMTHPDWTWTLVWRLNRRRTHDFLRNGTISVSVIGKAITKVMRQRVEQRASCTSPCKLV